MVHIVRGLYTIMMLFNVHSSSWSWSWSWLCTVSQTSSRNNQPLVHDVQAARLTECGAQVEGPVVACAFPGEVFLEAHLGRALQKELADGFRDATPVAVSGSVSAPEMKLVFEAAGLKIVRANKCNLKKLDSLSVTAELWKEVNKLINKKRQHDESGSLDAEALNVHYAAISHAPQYQTPAKKCTVTKNNSLVTEALMFKMLDSLHHTAEGADGIPAWFLRLAAPVLAGPLAHLVNLSLITATVPKQWKTAVIRPVPKVSQPKVPADYRPISIVPVLARMVERLVVQTYVYPAFQMEEMKHLLSDQYAFRPTGSTTAAVITIMQKVADLVSNKYVTIIALDFSKAFGTVRHHELAKKLAKLT